ncbi:MAG: hypothetical protein ABIL25_00520 [candidate division WOR-3 bacterium]
MLSTRVLLLALALESSNGGAGKLIRFSRRKDCYVATLLVKPDEYRLFGFLESEDGLDLLWQYTGQPKLARTG